MRQQIKDLQKQIDEKDDQLKSAKEAKQRAVQRVDAIFYAIENHLPDEKTAEEFKQQMKKMSELGVEAQLDKIRDMGSIDETMDNENHVTPVNMLEEK
jgi:carbonic anhydrase